MNTGSTSPPVQCALISLRQLDPAHGRPVQTWTFDDQAVVKIGRLEDNDVMLVDPIVSRLHAIIKRLNSQWELISLGRHGVLVSDRRVETLQLKHEMTFQLGVNGPVLQFLELDRAAPKESQTNRATIEINPSMVESLIIDRQLAEEQMREITDTEGFQRLLERARELREKRSPS